MKLRDDIQVHEKKQKIHLVPPLYKDPRDYLKLYDIIYNEICDKLNRGVDIGTYVHGVDGMYLLCGEILDENERSIDGEIRNGMVYKGHMCQIAVVCDGRVSFGTKGYKVNSILREGITQKQWETHTDDLEERSLHLLEKIARKYHFRIVSEYIEPLFQEKYLPDALKKARQSQKRQNPHIDKLGWLYEKRKAKDSSKYMPNRVNENPNSKPHYKTGHRREAAQGYRR